VAFAPLEVIMF